MFDEIRVVAGQELSPGVGQLATITSGLRDFTIQVRKIPGSRYVRLLQLRDHVVAKKNACRKTQRFPATPLDDMSVTE